MQYCIDTSFYFKIRNLHSDLVKTRLQILLYDISSVCGIMLMGWELAEADSPWQTFSTHSVTGAGTVCSVEAIEEGTVEAGFTLLLDLVFFEATGSAGHTIGILTKAKATFLRGLTEEIPAVREAQGGKEEEEKGLGATEKHQCGLTRVGNEIMIPVCARSHS